LFLALCGIPVASIAEGESLPVAKMVFVRTDSFTAALWPMVVRIDQARVATLYRGTYVTVDVEPGERVLRVFCAQRCAMRTLKVDAMIAADEIQYWVIDPEFKKEKGRRVLISRITRITRERFEEMSSPLRQVAPD
jgi:hypothetical protein